MSKIPRLGFFSSGRTPDKPRRVSPGESIAGYKVLAIEPRLVRLEGPGGGTVVVEMQ